MCDTPATSTLAILPWLNTVLEEGDLDSDAPIILAITLIAHTGHISELSMCQLYADVVSCAS